MGGDIVSIDDRFIYKSIEPEKVKIPQRVADWIEAAKTVYSLSGAMTYGGPVVNKWLENDDNQRTFVLAWFDGYEVEKEKRYKVWLKNSSENTYLSFSIKTNKCFFTSLPAVIYTRETHTRKELEDAGFGWVFDCEGIELVEVE